MEDIPELIIKAGYTERQYWQDLWRYRELLYFLTWRDILVRYKQTAVGIAWALIKPLTTAIAFTIVFSNIAKLPSDGVPYPILVFTALLPWQFFADTLMRCSSSLVSNAHLISKVYFPRLIVPASALAVSFVDFLISITILLALMAWYSFVPSWRILTLPLFLLIVALAAMGFGLWIASLSVAYRDFQQIVPLLIQFGLYVSPVGFSSSIVPEQWRSLYYINPMVSVIDGFRWAILGKDTQIYWFGLAMSFSLVLFIFISGIWYFRKTERTFADVI
jgi:lipopolysaccharide transport system permease protein